MQNLPALLRSISLHDLPQAFRQHRLESLSNLAVFEAACQVVSVPKKAALTSFTLHAPLELMARYQLLPDVEASARPLALMQMLATAVAYAQAGDEPSHWSGHGPVFAHTDDALHMLLSALDTGDVAKAMLSAASLADQSAGPLTISALCLALADKLVPRLAAAGHGVIFLNLLAHLDAAAAAHARHMLPGLMGELARHPHQLVPEHVMQHPLRPESASTSTTSAASTGAAPHEPTQELHHLLITLQPTAYAHKDSIVHIVQQAIDTGLLTKIDAIVPGLHPGAQAAQHAPHHAAYHDARADQADHAAAFQAICDVATRSMLEEPLTDAKYGWTHGLTLPQALYSLSASLLTEPHQALRMAALYAAGFRSTMGQAPLPEAEPQHPPSLAGINLKEALLASPDAAAATAWHLPAHLVDKAFHTLATEASIRPDAHLVKYVLACRDTSRMSASASASAAAHRRHLAAAARLTAAWMAEQPHERLEHTLHLR